MACVFVLSYGLIGVEGEGEIPAGAGGNEPGMKTGRVPIPKPGSACWPPEIRNELAITRLMQNNSAIDAAST